MLKITLYQSDLRHIGINKYANNVELEKNLTIIAVLDNATYNALTYNTAEFFVERNLDINLEKVNYIKCEFNNKKFYYTVNTFNYMQNAYYLHYLCDLDYFHTFIEDFYLQESIDRDVLLQMQQATVRADIYNKTTYLWQNPYLQHLPKELEVNPIKFGGVFSNDPTVRKIAIVPTYLRNNVNYYAYNTTDPYVNFEFTLDDNNKLSNKFLLMYAQKDWHIKPTATTLAPPLIILLAKNDGFDLINGADPLHSGYDLPHVINYNDAVNLFSNTEQLKMYQLPIDFGYLNFDRDNQDKTVLIDIFKSAGNSTHNASGISLGVLNANHHITDFWIYDFGKVTYSLNQEAKTGKTIDLFNQDFFFDSKKYHSSILMYYALNLYFTDTPLNLKCVHYLSNYENGNDINLHITCDGASFALTVKYEDMESYYNLNSFTNYFQQVDFTIPSTSDSWTNYRNNSPATSITSVFMPAANSLKNIAMAGGAGFMAGGPVGAAIGVGTGIVSGVEGIVNTLAQRYDLKHQENRLNSGSTFSKLLDWTNLHYEIDGLTPPELVKAHFYFTYFGNIVSQPMSLKQWEVDKNPDNVNFLRIANIEQAFNFIENMEIRGYFQNLFSNGVRLWTKKIQII